MKKGFFKSAVSLLAIIYFFAQSGRATTLDLNLLYFTDQFVAATTSKVSRLEYDMGIGFEASKDRQWVLALNYGSATFGDTTAASVTSTYVVSDMGFKVAYFFSKKRTWSTSVAYNIISTTKYNDGVNSEVQLRGTSLKADLGYTFWMEDSFGLSLKMFYYAPSHVESVVGTTLTKVTYKRTLIYPGLSLIYQY